MPNLYADLDTMKMWLQEEDRSSEDWRILMLCEDISRQIDSWAHHKFYVETRTRHLTSTRSDKLLLPIGVDLLAVTSIKTDEGDDGTYGTTWATTDYDLEPEDNPYASPPKPYWQIVVSKAGDYTFPTCRRGVEIVGKWGFYEVLERSSATASAIGSASTTSVTVSDGTQLSVGHTILIDNEQMYVSELDGNVLTVTRGVNGTTAATHGAAAAIDVYTYPLVREAVRLQFNRLASRRDSPLGAMGSSEFGVVRLSARLDPDVQALLSAGLRMRAVG